MNNQFHPARTFQRLMTANRAYQVLKPRVQKWTSDFHRSQAGPALPASQGRNSGQAVSFILPKCVAVQNRHRESAGVRIRFGCGRAHLGIDCDNDNPDRAYSEPLPKSSKAGLLRKLVERFHRSHSLQAFAFSFVVVIGNTLRRLASVLLLRQSQPPHGLALAQALNWCGLPTTRRSVFSRFKSLQKAKRGLSNRFEVLSRRVSHVNKHGAKSDGKIQKAFGEIRNV